MIAQKRWLWQCRGCRYIKSTLQPGGGAEIEGINHLRLQNFNVIANALASLRTLDECSLLEVGSSRGWFLDIARERGLTVLGIEPDKNAARGACQRGHGVRIGFFPDVLKQGEAFDIIAFNDVFEHLPDPAYALDMCHTHLAKNGLLAINLPLSTGIIYRMASLLNRVGCVTLLNRLWQKEIASPHISYFNQNNLKALAHLHGFEEIHRCNLKTVTAKGLWQRLRSGGFSRTTSLMLGCIIFLSLPFLSFLPNDFGFQVFRAGFTLPLGVKNKT